MMFTTFLKIEYYIFFLSFKNIYIFKFKNLHLENTFTNWKAKCLGCGMQFRKTLNPPSMSGAHPELYPSRLEQNRSTCILTRDVCILQIYSKVRESQVIIKGKTIL